MAPYVTDDDLEDERGLLDERWPDEKPVRRKKGACLEVWGIGFICLLSGMALGALLSHQSKPAECGTTTEYPSASQAAPAVTAPAVSSESEELFPANLSVTFNKNEMFQHDGGPMADSHWAKLLPLGRGFIQIDSQGNPIPHSDETPSDLAQTKVVSLFHQIHCLNNLRKSLFLSIDDHDTFIYLSYPLRSHWKHCFDYLRQSLMCSADMTLEDLEKSQADGRDLASVDGWGTEHQCRNFGEIFQWAEANRATDDGGID